MNRSLGGCSLLMQRAEHSCKIYHYHEPIARYVKLRFAHAPGMPGTFFPPPRVSDPNTHNGTCVTHVPWCIPGSLTSCFFWSRWQGKRSQHFWCMHNPQFYVSGKRPILLASPCNQPSWYWIYKPVDYLLFTFLVDVLCGLWCVLIIRDIRD